ncbi:MAG: outer membrane protein transport protein [Bacteroidia bacterium]|nr:outer membrane protein transport protein [Bacteroidia bacterium]
MDRFFQILIFIVFLAGNSLFAGGFQVNLQGQKQTGMAHTGAGLALDAATIFFNPAGMSFLDQSSLNVGSSPIFGRVAYREPYPGQYTASTEPGISTPFAAYGHWKFSKDDKFSLGLGVYTPFGSRVLYADDWKGQFLLREISLKAIFFQPTFSYRFNDKIGIGVGFVFAKGSVALRKAIPIQFSDGSYGEASLSGSGQGYGFNAGIYYKPTDKISLGLTHRSVVPFVANDGTAQFTVPDSAAAFFPNTSFSATLGLPSSTTLGIGYQATEKLSLALDVQFVGWSVYDTLGFDFQQNTDKLKDQASAREYKNAFIFRAGAQYALSDHISLRGGAYFDMTPVQDGYITPETPDANKLGISVGGTVQIGQYVAVDASFLWVEGMIRTAGNLETNFSGTFKARALIPGIGVNVLFPGKSKNDSETIQN